MSTTDPTTPPGGGLPPLGSQPLGKLAQSARGTALKRARGILIGIGVLTIIVNVAMVAMARGAIDQEVAKLQRQEPGMVIPPEAIEEAVRSTQVTNGLLVLVGVLYVVLGLIVQKYPVPVTVSALAIYLGVVAILAVLDPSTLAQGPIWKIVIIVALFRAIQAAFAAHREDAEAALGGAPA